ncbi:MAG TPA: glycosyltransferase [Ruminococcaceae bacterium]|jgi:glycosyltransferase involved in cell wall biosynthesis|nr:glycosyltransferase [Oscillospiraceae bacterium]HBG55761.1 glycosyltransferase [Oscillospiraceae bacterium]HBQ45507.1 glycosyltransferase [Oscillospiraceae bacterium]HBT90934.1 glycosyltransferase [Oscillospiraceae bacterium]HCB92131.1 glycosyltransferase [Oscillospiraceae bacterium]
MRISLVIPCYNEEKNIRPMFEAVKKAFCGLSYEMVFVDDGSKDKTLDELKKLIKQRNAEVQALVFSRNFGKDAAIYAGLKAAKGDFVTLIDADLQQDPAIARQMVNILEKSPEYDVVCAYQSQRRESFVLRLFKHLFYKIINQNAEVNFVDGASDFRTLRRNAVEALLRMTEYHRFSKGLFSWIGFPTKYLPYEAKERNAGTTKWNFCKLFRYAMEGLISFTTLPLRAVRNSGLVIALLAFLYAIVVMIQKLAFGIAVSGYATIVILILLLGGLNLFGQGVMGEYLSRIYIQAKNRPIYILKSVWTNEEAENPEKPQNPQR